jgi:predicted kinase
MTATPTLIVVSGAPGTGKTSLADVLGRSVGCPVVSRDAIKEGMVHAHGPGFRPAVGDELTQRTFPLFFKVIRDLLEGGVSVVAEAGFQDRVWRMGLESLLPLASVRVLLCHVTDDVAKRRMAERRVTDPRRVAHADQEGVVPPSLFQAITLDVPSLVIDTREGYVPTFEAILAFAR